MASRKLYFEQGTQPSPRKAVDDMSDLFLKRHALTVACRLDNKTGKLAYKEEYTDYRRDCYMYAFDGKGHLLKASRNGCPLEEYAYNAKGQRVSKQGHGIPGVVRYAYDEAGRLIRAGDETFTYDEAGNLALRRKGGSATRFVYEGTRLMLAIPSSGDPVRYEYEDDAENPVGPARKYRGDLLAMEYAWRDIARLESCADYERGLAYRFTYDARGALDRVHLTGMMRHPEYEKRLRPLADILWPEMEAQYPSGEQPMTGLQRLFGPGATEVVLLCGCDQVGTPKLFTLYNGKLIKKMLFDSFGTIIEDSNPGLPVPVGFAGGLHDVDTGLVRFGYRDYDPSVGRFTCPDPLGDTGGDHDVYDYCIDDPVTMNDPSGLFPPLLLGLGAMMAAGAIGYGVPRGIVALIDKIKGSKHGSEMDEKVLPPLAGTVAAGSVPLATAAAPGVVTAVGQRAGAAVHASKHGDTIIKGAQFAEGFLNPNAPTAPTFAGAFGAVTAYIKKEIDKKRND